MPKENDTLLEEENLNLYIGNERKNTVIVRHILQKNIENEEYQRIISANDPSDKFKENSDVQDIIFMLIN